MATITTTARNSTEPTAKKTRNTLGSPLIIGLIALLALQLTLALLPGIGGKAIGPAEPGQPLLPLDPEQITGIRIHTPDQKAPTVIEKGADGWTLPALQDLPADRHKVTALLTKLQDLRKGLPVATSEGSLERFRVADQAFERKLELARGDDSPLTLYLGDSPGFQRIFIRADGDGAVYEAKLGHLDAPDRPDDWSDRTLLHLDPENIEKLTFSGLDLQRTEDGDWRLADLTADEQQNQEATKERVLRLTNIGFRGVSTDQDPPEIDAQVAPIEIQTTLTDGATITYRITKIADGDDYLLQASNRPQGFRIAAYMAEELAAIQRPDLLKKPEEISDDAPSTRTKDGEGLEPTAEAATAQPVQAQPTSATGPPDEAGAGTP